MTPVTEQSVERQSWRALGSHYTSVSKLHLRELFKEDPERGERMTAEAVGLFLDYSKNRITDETEKMWCQRSTLSSTRWLTSQNECEAVHGKVIRDNASAT